MTIGLRSFLRFHGEVATSVPQRVRSREAKYAPRSNPDFEATILQMRKAAQRLFRSGWIDHTAHFRDAVCREAATGGMFAHRGFIRRDVNAIDFVVGHEAFQPLDLWTELTQHGTRFLRNGVQFARREFAGTRNFTLNDEFRHSVLPR